MTNESYSYGRRKTLFALDLRNALIKISIRLGTEDFQMALSYGQSDVVEDAVHGVWDHSVSEKLRTSLTAFTAAARSL